MWDYSYLVTDPIESESFTILIILSWQLKNSKWPGSQPKSFPSQDLALLEDLWMHPFNRSNARRPLISPPLSQCPASHWWVGLGENRYPWWRWVEDPFQTKLLHLQVRGIRLSRRSVREKSEWENENEVTSCEEDNQKLSLQKWQSV